MRAAGAVRRALRVARDGDRDVARAVEEPVHRLDAVAAVTTTAGAPSAWIASASARRSASSGTERPRARTPRAGSASRPSRAGTAARRAAATASSRRSRAPELAIITGSTTSGTRCAARGTSATVSIDRRAEEHPGLRRVDADVVEHRLELGADELGRHLVDRRHAAGVLRGQRHDRAHPVAAEARERLQVGLDPGAAARVRAGDREAAGHHWCRRLPSARWRPSPQPWDGPARGRGARLPDASSPAGAGAHGAGFPATSTRGSARRCSRRGITELYSHQADALAAARRGEHVLVATGTASGKTLAFNLPVLDALAADPKLRALYLYPTKALAQDQARALCTRCGAAAPCAPRSTTATPSPSSRWQIRKWANVILTNPDMLHVGVLPHHDRWGDVLANLRYVVVDEAHVYRGRLRLPRRERAAPPAAHRRRSTAPSRSSCSPRRRSRTRRARRERSLGEPRHGRRRATARRAPSARSRSGTRRSLDAELGLRASALGEASRLLARPRRARPAHDLLREEPQGRRADPPLRRRAARPAARARGSRRTGPATRPRSGARSSGASSTASSSA